MKNINGPLKVGIGGPVGAGKTSLTAALCKFLSKRIPNLDSFFFNLVTVQNFFFFNIIF